MEGLVIKTTGIAYSVYVDGVGVLVCHVKGNFRIRGIRTTNPVSVGDRVRVESQPDGTNWITEIGERRNYIIRRSTNLSKEAHILASNLDQALLLVTLRHPITNLIFIDRFLATAEAYRIPTVLVFNKVDLLSEEDMCEVGRLMSLYGSLGYESMALSANNLNDSPEALQQLRRLLTGKVTLLSGNSGVGKSTLVNALFGIELARTGLISSAHDKGMHTTTFSEMYSLPDCSGWLIDTPGIKGFGGVDMKKSEVSSYFREIFSVGCQCRFDDCLHMPDTPGCAVCEAVVSERIAMSRYESYMSLLGDCEETKYR